MTRSPTRRLTRDDVACWVLKSSRPPGELVPGWTPGTTVRLRRCLRRSYRLELMAPGQPCLLWTSGRVRPGVHALGALAEEVEDDGGEQAAVLVALTLLAEPVDRAELLADPVAGAAEVLRMPAGSNPSWLSAAQFAVVRAQLAGTGP